MTRARIPRAPYYHPGDFVWQLYADAASDDVRIWPPEGSDSIGACAIFEPPLRFEFETDPTIGSAELSAEIIRWADKRRAAVVDRESIPRAYQSLGSGTLSTSAFDTDAARIAVLAAHGFARDDAQGDSYRMVRRLDEPLPDVALPEGARFRRIGAADEDERAELHRDAWSVWGDSQHTLERYRDLRAAPLYAPELDVVLEYEGRLVSYCVCWLDPVNRVGLFEPVGTRPSGTRRGFGRMVIHEAFRRLRAKGMTTATVGTGTVNRPAMALYASAGFEVAETQHIYVKPDAA